MGISIRGKNGEKKAKRKCVLFYPIFESSGGKQMFSPERFQQSAFSRQQNTGQRIGKAKNRKKKAGYQYCQLPVSRT
jgi:hypothetical protein